MLQDTFSPLSLVLGHVRSGMVEALPDSCGEVGCVAEGLDEKFALFRRVADLVEVVEDGDDGIDEENYVDAHPGQLFRAACCAIDLKL